MLSLPLTLLLLTAKRWRLRCKPMMPMLLLAWAVLWAVAKLTLSASPDAPM
jgi:hypothetical protein